MHILKESHYLLISIRMDGWSARMHCTLYGWMLNFSTFWHRLKCVCSTLAQIHLFFFFFFFFMFEKKKEFGSGKWKQFWILFFFSQRKVWQKYNFGKKKNVISNDTKPHDIVMQRLWDLMLHLPGVCCWKLARIAQLAHVQKCYQCAISPLP